MPRIVGVGNGVRLVCNASPPLVALFTDYQWPRDAPGSTKIRYACHGACVGFQIERISFLDVTKSSTPPLHGPALSIKPFLGIFGSSSVHQKAEQNALTNLVSNSLWTNLNL